MQAGRDSSFREFLPSDFCRLSLVLPTLSLLRIVFFIGLLLRALPLSTVLCLMSPELFPFTALEWDNWRELTTFLVHVRPSVSQGTLWDF